MQGLVERFVDRKPEHLTVEAQSGHTLLGLGLDCGWTGFGRNRQRFSECPVPTKKETS
jgi:hypothetical protein